MIESAKYPNAERFSILEELFADRTLQGKIINPLTHDVCVWTISKRQRFLMAAMWDVLGYLDNIWEKHAFDSDQLSKLQQSLNQANVQLQQTSQQVQQISQQMQQVQQMSQQVQQMSQQIEKIRTAVDTILSVTHVMIPWWRDKHQVLTGFTVGGDPAPSAAELGLIVEFVVNAARHESPGLVLSITPNWGTLVLRGSKVTVVHEAEG